ncbi:MAG: CDP-6-deoxy-delta-3,4-glucoseen reductase [Betaproteobacteria bacterium]|nr:MAG: CDP-6-deoxy-delta-3,4-glucoseen reductase [Betaproteobacteria bacterium]
MSQITLEPGHHRFACDAEESILTAALRAGLLIPYGCKSGACGSCKARILSGAVRHGPYQPTTLSAAELAEGKALLCVAHPEGEVTVEARDVRKAGDLVVKTMPCRIESLERATDDVMIVRFKLPANETLNYRAGQYIDFLLKDGKRRSFSIANPPHDAALIELHIRHTPGGFFTDRLFGVSTSPIKPRDILRFEGAHGSFFLREESTKPIVLVASGTGFAPIKALVEHALHIGSQRPMTLYWGGRRPKDLYLNDLAETWERAHPSLVRYVPVVSEATDVDAWGGRTGFVHRAVMADFPDLSGHQVYACGAPIVVDSARADFVSSCGLPEQEFFADSFTLAAATSS